MKILLKIVKILTSSLKNSIEHYTVKNKVIKHLRASMEDKITSVKFKQHKTVSAIKLKAGGTTKSYVGLES